MISHYDTMYWSCGLCSKNFKRIKNVKYHLRAAHALLDKEDVRKQCVKLRKAPTKAEIEQLSRTQTVIKDTESAKTEFVLPEFKPGLTNTFELAI